MLPGLDIRGGGKGVVTWFDDRGGPRKKFTHTYFLRKNAKIDIHK